MSCSIGVDIGGTSTRAAVIDDGGRTLHVSARATRRGADAVTQTAIEAVHDVLAAAALRIDDIDVIGVGVPGTVDPRAGTVRHAVNVGIGPEPVTLAASLSSHFGMPVHIENDVRAAALGAAFHLESSGIAAPDLAYLSIGTGIAAGHVEHGRLRRGSSLAAGEIGHIPIDPNGPRCACGQRGCIEAIASGSAIERLWPVDDASPARALLDAVNAGDERAAGIWSGVVGGLSRAVLVLALTLDPALVVLGGGVAELGDDLLVAITTRLSADRRESAFLDMLDIGSRLRIIEPGVLVGTIGAVRAARSSLVAAGDA